MHRDLTFVDRCFVCLVASMASFALALIFYVWGERSAIDDCEKYGHHKQTWIKKSLARDIECKVVKP